MPTATPEVLASAGLTSAEVAERVAAGLVNRAQDSPSRTVRQIVRANVFTTFNALLGAMFVVIVAVAPPQDAAFGLVLVVNTAIGIIQELRAKRTLDRLAILAAPQARVVRDGRVAEIDPSGVVVDDVIEVGTGDEVVVDGEVVSADGFEIDESLLTGEAEPVAKHEGDRLLSGSFAVAGTGRYRATAVGAEAYAAQLASSARQFKLLRSDLQRDVDRILRWVAVALVPAAGLLVWGQVRSGLSWRPAAQRSVAGVVAMVPEGLVLLVSVALAVAIIRLGRQRCLVKELAGVEGLARVTVVCVDKTGTLTEGTFVVDAVHPCAGVDLGDAEAVVGAVAGADPQPNATMAVLAEEFAAPEGWHVESRLAFSSARKWSGVAFRDRGAYVVGAPEVLLATGRDGGPGRDDGPVRDEDGPGRDDGPRRDDGPGRDGGSGRDAALRTAGELAASGQRVLLLASLRDAGALERGVLGAGEVEPVAVVGLNERLRPDAADTVSWFLRQGVEIRVLSGDSPLTVGAVAERVGVPQAADPVDARGLPDDIDELAGVLADHSVFGRVTPDQKRKMIGALQQAGHVVAMTGDGVNDVLALKDADLGVAMGAGAAATRAVANVVLLDSSWSSLPALVAEGQRVIANLERVANLFLTKTVYAVLLAIAVGVAGVAYPFLPRHLTVVSGLAIGIPGFLLAVSPAREPARGGFLRRVARLAGPAGVIIAAAVLVVMALAHGHPQDEQQLVSATTLMALSLVVLALVARPLSGWRVALLAGLAGASAVALTVPPARRLLALSAAPGALWVQVVAVIVVAAVLLVVVVGGSLDAWRSGRRRDERSAPGPHGSVGGRGEVAPDGEPDGEPDDEADDEAEATTPEPGKPGARPGEVAHP